MKLMKSIRLFAAAFCGCAAAVGLAACGQENAAQNAKQTYTIGISIPSADHGWTGGIVSWAEQAKKDIEAQNPDVKVVVSTGKSSSEQVAGIENLMMKNINALVCLPHQPEALTAVCEKAKNSGVKLVVVDRGLTKPIHDLEVVGDNYGFGKACAKAIAAELNGKGSVIVMEGVLCQTNTDRVSGFNDEMKNYPEIKILQSERADWSEEKGFKLMEEMLAKFPAIDAVWAGDDDVLRGALKAYEKSKRSDVKLMVGGGGSKFIVKKVLDKDPLVRLTVTYPPKMIYVAAQEALKMRSAMPKGKRIVVPADTVKADNAKNFYFPDSRY